MNMTFDEITHLEKTANMKDLDSFILLTELYCTEYTKICCDNVIYFLYLQSFKLIWTNLKKQLPAIVSNENLLQVARDLKSQPNQDNFEALMKLLKRESQTSTDTLKQLTHIVRQVLIAISQNLTSICNKTFGRYANDPITIEFIGDFVSNPSYKSFADMIQRIASFGQTHKEIELARRQLLSIFEYLQEKEIDKFDTIKDKCHRIALLTDAKNEYRFIMYLSESHKGDPQAMLYIGQYYENGTGVRRNETEAEKWYTRALLEGNSNAQSFITNLRSKLHEKVIEEQYKRQLLEQENNLENLKRELQEERAKARRLEQEILNVTQRHNLEIENLQKQLVVTEKARQTTMDKLSYGEKNNSTYEENNVEVIFYYKLHCWNGDIIHRNTICKISFSTYNSLIAGGQQAITSFITGLQDYIRDGEYVFNTSMSKL